MASLSYRSRVISNLPLTNRPFWTAGSLRARNRQHDAVRGISQLADGCCDDQGGGNYRMQQCADQIVMVVPTDIGDDAGSRRAASTRLIFAPGLCGRSSAAWLECYRGFAGSG
jgi:hypothetical protein